MAVETIDLPVLGKTKATWVYAGGAAAAGVVVYAWWTRGGGESPAEGEATAGMLVDEYGNPLGVESGDYKPPTILSGTQTVDENRPAQPVTNAEWTQRAAEYLVQELGYDAITVGNALGRYLRSAKLMSTAELDAVQAALAVMGNPPQGAFSIVPPGPEPPNKDVPGPITGLRVSKRTRTSITWSWNPQAHTRYYFYKCWAGAPPNVKEVKRGIRPGGTPTVTVSGLRPNAPYRLQVRGERTGIGVGPWAALNGSTLP